MCLWNKETHDTEYIIMVVRVEKQGKFKRYWRAGDKVYVIRGEIEDKAIRNRSRNI